jgi:hypothetical protein
MAAAMSSCGGTSKFCRTINMGGSVSVLEMFVGMISDPVIYYVNSS